MIRKSPILWALALALLVFSSGPARSLTRDTVRSANHLFTYSIEPNWKSGAIKKKNFKLFFSLFNDDEKSFHLEKIVVNFPDGLDIKRRPWDGQPLIKPRKSGVDIKGDTVIFNYNETLRGYTEDKPIKSKFIYIHLSTNHTVTGSINFIIYWTKPDSTKVHKIRLKKDLDIQLSTDNDNLSKINGPSNDTTIKSRLNNQETPNDPTSTQLKEPKPRQWLIKLLEETNNEDVQLLYNYLVKSQNPISKLKRLIKLEQKLKGIVKNKARQ